MNSFCPQEGERHVSTRKRKLIEKLAFPPKCVSRNRAKLFFSVLLMNTAFALYLARNKVQEEEERKAERAKKEEEVCKKRK